MTWTIHRGRHLLARAAPHPQAVKGLGMVASSASIRHCRGATTVRSSPAGRRAPWVSFECGEAVGVARRETGRLCHRSVRRGRLRPPPHRPWLPPPLAQRNSASFSGVPVRGYAEASATRCSAGCGRQVVHRSHVRSLHFALMGGMVAWRYRAGCSDEPQRWEGDAVVALDDSDPSLLLGGAGVVYAEIRSDCPQRLGGL